MLELIESSEVMLAMEQHESLLPDKRENFNWKQWAKAGLVVSSTFATAFLLTKSTGILRLVNDWLWRRNPENKYFGRQLFQLQSPRTVNQPPVLLNNALTIKEGGQVILSRDDLDADDPDGYKIKIAYLVSDVKHGQFELLDNPNEPVTVLMQQDIFDGKIRFVHDNTTTAPAYKISVYDGISLTYPSPAMVKFYSEKNKSLGPEVAIVMA